VEAALQAAKAASEAAAPALAAAAEAAAPALQAAAEKASEAAAAAVVSAGLLDDENGDGVIDEADAKIAIERAAELAKHQVADAAAGISLGTACGFVRPVTPPAYRSFWNVSHRVLADPGVGIHSEKGW
jgi:hypothetical protein